MQTEPPAPRPPVAEDGSARLASIAELAAQALGATAAAVWLRGQGWRAAWGCETPALTAAVATALAAARDGVVVTASAPPWESVVAAPLTREDGAIAGALCVLDLRARRLTPRRRAVLGALATLAAEGAPVPPVSDAPADAEARRMRARFEAIFENTDASVFIKRRNGEILAANQKYRRMAGRDDVVGRTDRELYGPEIGAALRERDRDIFATGQPFTGEERVVFPTGEEVIYLSYKFLIYDAALDDLVLCGIATDITAQKRLQASLEKSRREAEEANAAKAQFLAAVSHEIRTPMNGVLGMLALLAGTELDERQRAMAQIARESAADLLAILNDIIDFARAEAHELTFARVPFDLRGALVSVGAAMRAQAQKKGLTLEVALDPALPTRIVGDQARFRQVLAALLANAVKFTDEGAIRLAARPSATGVEVVVSDTGVGIAAEAQGRIFAGFSQADGSSTRRFGGLGLGLSISKRLVEGMGGEIGLSSAEGQGSTFWFTVPLAPPADA